MFRSLYSQGSCTIRKGFSIEDYWNSPLKVSFRKGVAKKSKRLGGNLKKKILSKFYLFMVYEILNFIKSTREQFDLIINDKINELTKLLDFIFSRK